MASTRLNSETRRALMRVATSDLKPAQEFAQLELAHSIAAPLVVAHVERRYPPKDMAVLLRYDKAYSPSHVVFNINTPGCWGTVRFEFSAVASLPAQPARQPKHEYGGERVFVSDPSVDIGLEVALAAWVEALAAYKKEFERRKQAYYDFIKAAKTFEEVVALWPAVESLRPVITGRSVPTILRTEIEKIIAEDQAERPRPETLEV